MSTPISLRADFDAPTLRQLARRSLDADQARRLDQCLSPCDLQIAEEASTGSRIGFRDRGQLGPGQIGLDQRDVRRPHSGIFGIAAIDGAAEAAPSARLPSHRPETRHPGRISRGPRIRCR